MPEQSELRHFLQSRRARLTPADVGLPWHDGRRVAGLRREELASLAGVSVDYYTRLEQGRARNVSDQVLTAVADALQLHDLERRHLFDLVRAAAPKRPGGQTPGSVPTPLVRARPALHALIQTLDPMPAMLYGPRLEVLGGNRMSRILFDDFSAMPVAERNLARWMFLNPRAREVYVDWEDIARQMVSVLHFTAGRDAGDPALAALVDGLRARSELFARYWSDYAVFQHTYGLKRFHHSAVGMVTLHYETLHPPADHDIYLTVYTAPAGSPSEEKLRLLSSWATSGATPHEHEKRGTR
ncbi:helix-turn-helix transcriptional regulator [Sphaerisporangium dianthi]|uniref:Helix-turn-helix transcriptional regulator n=1 Tax=Sphaerisporangium dianthi TaxID=1436120 RepID=A0ABV9CJD6_9ACTN